MRWRSARRRTVLVTGATGFLGHHLLRSGAAANWELVAPGSQAMDVRRRETVIETITGWRPQIVVHLAYRRDDRRCIVEGSRNVAEGAAACGARLVHMSTDVVFGGRSLDYHERDLPAPVNEYGLWKAQAEAAVTEVCPAAAIVRTSLLYGTDLLGEPQTQVERAIRDGTSMVFFTDEVRCPAHAGDVADGIARVAALPNVSGPVHIAGPEPISRADLSVHIARWMGLDRSRLHCGTTDPSLGPRPGRLVLDSTWAATLGISCRPVGVWMPLGAQSRSEPPGPLGWRGG